jgi:hypothetical protein
MRPGQNKRMRGRNNNHRKGPNPLTRTYESNGPDVKIRGTAHHVAEKYLQLARDAQSSGDPVMAESYLQHAEHYFRLIAAAQLAQQQAQMGTRSDDDDSDDDEDFSGLPDRFASPIERQPVPPPFPANGQQQPQGNYPNPNQPQPYGDRPQQPQGERQYQDRPQGDRNNQGDRQYQDRNQDRGPRQDRNQGDRNNQDRPFFDRNNNQNRNRNNNRDYNNRDNNQNRNNGPRDFQQPEAPRFDNQPEPQQQISRPPAIEPDVPVGLPSFITAPVRTVMPDAPQPVEAAPNAPIETGAEHEEAAFHLRNRRRRRPKAAANGDGEVAGPLTDEVPAGE